ncbi:hypothetical protein A2U01_0042036, partial [Trifolium medium]|nr:hypothetical protein [Trifolium medium]
MLVLEIAVFMDQIVIEMNFGHGQGKLEAEPQLLGCLAKREYARWAR